MELSVRYSDASGHCLVRSTLQDAQKDDMTIKLHDLKECFKTCGVNAKFEGPRIPNRL